MIRSLTTTHGPGMLIADDLQIIRSRVRDAIDCLNPAPIRLMVRSCVAAGAQAIDINCGPLPRDAAIKMRFLVDAVQAETALPLVLDTGNPEAMEAGLQAARSRCIINGFSLEPHKLARVLPLAKKYGTDIIGYLLHSDSRVPAGADERLQIAAELYAALTSGGIARERLIVDPVVVPITWENGPAQAMAVLDVIRMLPDLLGYSVRTVAGLSNLTSGSGTIAQKRVLEQAYAPMLSAAGLDMFLLNSAHHETLRILKACRILSSKRIFSWAELQ